MADRDSRSHYNKIVNMTAAINIDFNLSSINHDVAKAKDLEHKLGNLILMTRPLRRQSQRPNLRRSHNLSRGKLVSTETPKETCRLWSCASASAQLKQCIIKYATYVPSTAHFPSVCVCAQFPGTFVKATCKHAQTAVRNLYRATNLRAKHFILSRTHSLILPAP